MMELSTPTIEQPDMRDFLEFLLDTCRVLMQCGCSSNRVEHLNSKLGVSWGFAVETMALPTGIWISVRRGDERMIELTRIHHWTVDLDRLSRLNDLIDCIHEHSISLKEARQRLRDEMTAPPPYSAWLTLLAGGGASAVFVYFYRGIPLEVALAFPAGSIVQIMQKYLFVDGDKRFLADFLSAAFVALYAYACRVYFSEIDVPRLVIGGMIALVPGLVLVNAVHEIAQKNLVSGAAKLLEAMVITASLACGVLFVLGFVLLI